MIAPASASPRRSRRPGTNRYSSMTTPTDRATATVRGMPSSRAASAGGRSPSPPAAGCAAPACRAASGPPCPARAPPRRPPAPGRPACRAPSGANARRESRPQDPLGSTPSSRSPPTRTAPSVIRPSAPDGRRDRGDRVGDVLPAGRGGRERPDDRVDDGVVDVLVPQDEAEDRHEHDRQRHDREQHPVGDARRKLRAPVREVAIHGRHEDTHDPACGADAPLPDAPG